MSKAPLTAQQLAEAFGLLRWPFLPLDERTEAVLTSPEFADASLRLEERFEGRPGVGKGACGAAAAAVGGRKEHEALYHGCFRGNMVLSPFQADYTSSHAFDQARQMADIGGFYGAFGLAASPAGVDRSDHIAAELEFLCVVTWHEAQGISEGDAERARVARSAREKFLEEHAGRWFAEFAKRCKERKAPDLFTSTAALAAALVAEQLEDLDVVPQPPAASVSLPLADPP